jgi:ABC-2 type transport system permease protein
MLPLVFLIFAVGAGSRAIAGEEEQGTLDTLLANPIPRPRVLLEKVAAMVVATLALGAVLVVALVVGVIASDMNIAIVRLVEQVVSLTILAIALGSLSLAIGCLTGSRSMANGVTGAVAVGAYLVDALASSVHALEPYQWLSPFHYYAAHDPIAQGLSAVHAAALVASAALLVGAALVAFERRDLAA